MRSFTYLLAAAPFALALSACGSGTTVADPSDPEQIAEAMSELPKPEPGEYSMKGELIEFDIPGATDEEVGMMRGLFEMGLQAGNTFCITEEMAEKSHEEWLTQSQNVPDGCEFSSYETTADSFNGVMKCDSPDGTKGTISLGGTITSTSQSMQMEMDMTNANEGPGSMRMVMKTETNRVGDCPA